MGKWLPLVLVLGLACGANAALTLVGAPTEPIKIEDTVTITVANSEDGGYTGWLEMTAPVVAGFDGAPELTPAANPGGVSKITYWPDYGEWYEFSISSFPPSPAIAAGDHIVIHVKGLSEGSTTLNLYASDGVKLLDQVTIAVIPEPATIVLLGLGGLLLHRRR